MFSDEMIAFYNKKFGHQAIAKFFTVGRRREHSPEHTLEALSEVYDTHRNTPFTGNTIIGQMVHARAAGFRRQDKPTEIDAWEILKKLSTPKTFRQKLSNWMQWGKWE